MSIKAASLFVEIGADTKGADAGISRVGKGVTALGEVGTGAMKVLGGAIVGAGAGLLSLGNTALDAYGDFERLGMSLQQMAAKELLNAGQAATMGAALGQASGKASELQGWIQKLAIQSPFTQTGVSDAFRMAMAYGFTTTQSQRLTKAMIDFAAGSGASEYAMSKIALALGQIRAKGKLAGGEVLQLTEAGINVNEILAKAFNTTTAAIVDMREKGLIPADQAIDAIVTSMESDFGGAAARQAGSIAGLKASLMDLKDVGLREFFTATFQEAQPYLNEMVNKLQDPETIAQIRAMGVEFANTGKEIINTAVGVVDWFNNLSDAGKTAAVGAGLLALNMGTVVKVVGGFYSIAVGLPAVIGGISDAFLAWRLGMTLAEGGLASIGVTIGAVAAAAAAAVGVWVMWNEQIVKTNQAGAQGIAGKFGEDMAKIRENGGTAADAVDAFGKKFAIVNDQISGGGFAGLFIDRTQIARESLGELSGQLTKMNLSYEEYMQSMTTAARSTGVLSGHQAQQVLRSGNQAMITQWLSRNLGVLTQEQYQAAIAAEEMGAATQSAAWHQHELRMAAQFSGEAAQQSAASFLQVGQAAQMSTDDIIALGQAQQDFSAAVMSFNQNYGDQLAQGLEAAGIKGEKLTTALGTIDSNLGTNTLATYNAKQAMEEMITQYQQTGDIAAFDQALGDNRDQWAKIDEAIQNALTSWRELIGSIGSVNGQHITMFVDIVSSYGSSGWESTPSSNRSGQRHGGEADDGDVPGRALGGPVESGGIYRWREHGDELFVPATDGYVMNGADTAKLLRLLEQGAGARSAPGGSVIFNVYETSNARQTALEIARIQRR